MRRSMSYCWVADGKGEPQVRGVAGRRSAAGRALDAGRRGDAQHFELPATELGLVQMQPVEGAMDRRVCGEACDAELGGGGHSLSSRLGGRVFDGDEEEALGWGGGASGRAVAGCEQGRNRVRQDLPPSLAGRRYYHPTQEGRERALAQRMDEIARIRQSKRDHE